MGIQVIPDVMRCARVLVVATYYRISHERSRSRRCNVLGDGDCICAAQDPAWKEPKVCFAPCRCMGGEPSEVRKSSL